MCDEVSLGSTDYNELNERYGCSPFQSSESSGNFYETIFSKAEPCRFMRIVSFQKRLSHIDENTQKIAQNCGMQIAPMRTVSGEAGVKYEWGGKDGGGVSGYVSGSASDNNGNTAEVEVTVNNDGSGDVTVSVSHDEEN